MTINLIPPEPDRATIAEDEGIPINVESITCREIAEGIACRLSPEGPRGSWEETQNLLIATGIAASLYIEECECIGGDLVTSVRSLKSQTLRPRCRTNPFSGAYKSRYLPANPHKIWPSGQINCIL